jgi:hypothetical protein
MCEMMCLDTAESNFSKFIIFDYTWLFFQTLLPAANLLQLTDVRDACCEFLLAQLHPTNCLGIKVSRSLFGFKMLAVKEGITVYIWNLNSGNANWRDGSVQLISSQS